MSKFISIFILFFLLLKISFIYAGTGLNHVETDTSRTSWSDSVLTSLSLEEKIAQLMMIRTYSNKDKTYYDRVEETIKKYNIGGLCFFQGGPVMQAKLTNRYQATAKTPLLISMDAEWGLGMRLDSTFSFPYQMTLGAIRDNGLIYEMATEIARQMKLLGVHINFAPVADVNNNPANPVINSRSFGESQMEVTEKSIAYMKGLQENGMIATAKHFPGHGDTDSDSHYTLPVIRHSRQRLDSVELYPFQQLINAGLDAVMVAHLFVTNLDSTKNTPTTLSKAVVTDLLRTEMGFDGMIITDALDMKGATSSRKPGEIELEAFLAGNDILLLPQDVSAAITEIMNAVKTGLVPEEMINERCSRVLRFKQKAGLDKYAPALTDSLYEKLNGVNNELISRKIYEAAVTVIKNESNILPLSHLDTLKIAALSIGSPEITPFQNMLGNYSKIDFYNILSTFTVNQAAAMIEKLTPYNLIIISLHNTNIFSNKNFGLTPQTFKLIDKIAEKEKVILALFANPYSLSGIIHPDKLASIIIGYQDNSISNEITAQVIMGSIDAGGRLPVLISDTSFFQSGININSIQRLKYTIPEEVGIASVDLSRIDTIALSGIRNKATPGCQILVAKDGKVIYRKSFGYHTYKKADFVKNTDLYDLASITKIAASTLAVMKLSDEGKLDIDAKLVWYLPYLKGSNKEDIIIREMMAHQAQFKPWIPFYLSTTKNKKPDQKYYTSAFDQYHTVKVADNLYIRDDYKTVMYDSIVKSRLLKKKEYVYSDLGFYLLKQTIEILTGQTLENYTAQSFYNPLGLQTMGFNPLERFDRSFIIPTEKDSYFRNQLIHGYVHDQGAAMLGGVSGHAGLFSNANDLAVIMQMLLQGGSYGGTKYFEESTVNEFTKQQFPLDDNRRGIGFDKPEPENPDDGPTCRSASASSFGHTGFTGTYTWVDPDHQLVYIFLSNRVHPDAQNTKLNSMKIRKEIQQVIYDAVNKAELNTVPNKMSALPGTVND